METSFSHLSYENPRCCKLHSFKNQFKFTKEDVSFISECIARDDCFGVEQFINKYDRGKINLPCFSLRFAKSVKMCKIVIELANTPCIFKDMCNYSRKLLELPISTRTRNYVSKLQEVCDTSADIQSILQLIKTNNLAPYNCFDWQRQHEFLDDVLLQTMLIKCINTQLHTNINTCMRHLPETICQIIMNYILSSSWKDVFFHFYQRKVILPPT